MRRESTPHKKAFSYLLSGIPHSSDVDHLRTYSNAEGDWFGIEG